MGDEAESAETDNIPHDIDRYLAGKLRESHAKVNQPPGQAVKLFAPGQAEGAKQQWKTEHARRQQLKAAARRGEYRGVRAELANDIRAQQSFMEEEKQKLEGSFPDDDRHKELNRELEVAWSLQSHPLTEPQTSFVEGVAEGLQAEITATSRGSVQEAIGMSSRQITKLEGIQAQIPQPKS
ncbi:hypothetical protein ACFL2C_02070 [Patescibacteria group bacterium]